MHLICSLGDINRSVSNIIPFISYNIQNTSIFSQLFHKHAKNSAKFSKYEIFTVRLAKNTHLNDVSINDTFFLKILLKMDLVHTFCWNWIKLIHFAETGKVYTFCWNWKSLYILLKLEQVYTFCWKWIKLIHLTRNGNSWYVLLKVERVYNIFCVRQLKMCSHFGEGIESLP